jgi:hypothetical protein
LNAVFTATAAEQLQRLAQSMPGIWTQLEERGFQVSRMFFHQLATLKPLDPDLRPAKDYFVEVLKERFQRLYTFWGPDARPKAVAGGYRSEYLDLLTAKITSNAWPELGAASRYAFANLDPSLLRYSHLKLSETDLWLEILAQYESRKNFEAAQLPATLRQLLPDGAATALKNVESLLDEAFLPKQFDKQVVGKGDNKSILFSRVTPNRELRLVCRFADPRGMRAGHWPLLIGFMPPAHPVDAYLSMKSTPIVCDSNTLWPGSHDYMRHLRNPGWIALGCVVVAELMQKMFEQLSSVSD